jgi:hypothetical protein
MHGDNYVEINNIEEVEKGISQQLVMRIIRRIV